MELPHTNQRVAQNTPPRVNQKIREEIHTSVAYYKANPHLISKRLNELDKEWDIERVLETNASTLIVAGTTLGLTKSRKFFAIPLVVGTFLLQHALQGWCPPLPILRRMGYRTTDEIRKERTALEIIYMNNRQKPH